MAKKTNPSQSTSAEQLAQKAGVKPSLSAPTPQAALDLAVKVLVKKKKVLDDAGADEGADAAQDADQDAVAKEAPQLPMPVQYAAADGAGADSAQASTSLSGDALAAADGVGYGAAGVALSEITGLNAGAAPSVFGLLPVLGGAHLASVGLPPQPSGRGTPPAPSVVKLDESDDGDVTDGMDSTHFARLCAERELGRGIARRWFS